MDIVEDGDLLVSELSLIARSSIEPLICSLSWSPVHLLGTHWPDCITAHHTHEPFLPSSFLLLSVRSIQSTQRMGVLLIGFFRWFLQECQVTCMHNSVQMHDWLFTYYSCESIYRLYLNTPNPVKTEISILLCPELGFYQFWFFPLPWLLLAGIFSALNKCSVLVE